MYPLAVKVCKSLIVVLIVHLRNFDLVNNSVFSCDSLKADVFDIILREN